MGLRAVRNRPKLVARRAGNAKYLDGVSSDGSGESLSADELLLLVYQELKRLAQAQMRGERSAGTLGATGLVHEAWMRLGGEGASPWSGRGHFVAAAAEAMRRVLVDEARKRSAAKRGGDRARVELFDSQLVQPERAEELVALDEALDRLADADSQTAELVKLRFHVGLSGAEAAAALGISPRKADQMWAYARAWLRREIGR